jgi:hypothetical protein
MIDFICPGSCCCGYSLRVPDEYAGRVIACPRSAQRVRVPDGPMTEAKWLSCPSPGEMLLMLSAPASARQLLLFAAACCSRVAHLLDGPARTAVEAVERSADGLITAGEFQAATKPIYPRYREESMAALAGGAGNQPGFRLPAPVAALGRCSPPSAPPTRRRRAGSR